MEVVFVHLQLDIDQVGHVSWQRMGSSDTIETSNQSEYAHEVFVRIATFCSPCGRLM